MPCRVSSDVHEWNNEGPAVPAYNPVKPHNVDEQSTNLCRGEKTLWSLQPVVALWLRMQSVGSRYGQFSGTDLGKSVTPAICYRIANLFNRDIGRWAVRLGRHPLENVSRGPKDWLRRDRNPPVRAKP